jgi:hypothetical protein
MFACGLRLRAKFDCRAAAAMCSSLLPLLFSKSADPSGIPFRGAAVSEPLKQFSAGEFNREQDPTVFTLFNRCRSSGILDVSAVHVFD